MGVLLLADLPEPSNYTAEGERVLWTLVGVAIAVLVMFLGNLLARRISTTRPDAASRPAASVAAGG